MQKPSLNRLLSRPLTALLVQTPLVPNHVTAMSLGLGILAGFFFSNGVYASSLLAAGCYELAIVLDNCDGEIARAKNLKSAWGARFDVAADFVTDGALFSGLALGLSKQGMAAAAGLGMLCLTGLGVHFALVLAEKKKGFGPAVFETAHPDSGRRQNLFFRLFDALREGEASWFVVLFALAGKTGALLWLGAFYMQALWISALGFNFKWLFPEKPQ